MIITLKGADFSASNIGTLSSWRISRSLGSGATYAGVTSVDKGAAFTATVTLAEGYEVGTAGITITMGGTVLSGAHSISDNVITITIASVTGNVLIKVPTINTATGEEEEPDVPDTPGTGGGTTAGFTSFASEEWQYFASGTTNRIGCYPTLQVGDVVNFKDASLWDTYKYAIGAGSGKGAGTTWIGGSYQSGAYTVTSTGVYTIMVAKQDNADFSDTEKAQFGASIGYTR
jgi:hypothetical protein